MKYMLSAEDKILIKTGGNPKDFLPEKWRLEKEFSKVAHNRFHQTPCSEQSATVIPNCR